jgi:DNA-binding NtrC family response regulator
MAGRTIRHVGRRAAGLRSPGHLVVRSVSALDRDQQQALLAWLDAPGNRMQVISTTTDPLYPLVSRGAFLANLYYRLNVLLLDVAPSDHISES